MAASMQARSKWCKKRKCTRLEFERRETFCYCWRWLCVAWKSRKQIFLRALSCGGDDGGIDDGNGDRTLCFFFFLSCIRCRWSVCLTHSVSVRVWLWMEIERKATEWRHFHGTGEHNNAYTYRHRGGGRARCTCEQAIAFHSQTIFDCSFDLIWLPLCLRFVRNKNGKKNQNRLRKRRTKRREGEREEKNAMSNLSYEISGTNFRWNTHTHTHARVSDESFRIFLQHIRTHATSEK